MRKNNSITICLREKKLNMSKKNMDISETNVFERENISSSTSGINISNRLKIITNFFYFITFREKEREK